jgi:hypothetical protein
MDLGAPMQTNDDLDLWEHRLEAQVETDTSVEQLSVRRSSARARAKGCSRKE